MDCSFASVRAHGRSFRVAVALTALTLSAVAVLAQAWAPNETQISPQGDLIDLEFNQSKGLLAWNSDDGKLWVASVDRGTGAFLPSDAKGILVDADTMTFQDAQKTKNGPEWVRGTGGDFIVYTKYAGYHTDGNSRIGVAQQAPDGGWSGGFLAPGSAVRKAPYGSVDADDPAPRITYVDNREVHYWRELWNPSSEQAITDFPASNYPIRHVRGARAVAYPLATPSGIDQIFFRNLDTGVVEQVTFDAGKKYEVWMWRAPEFGNEFVFLTLVDQIELRVYRKLPTGAGAGLQWTPIYSQMASTANQIFSPEPFVWNGKSYVFMAQSVKPNKFRSEIWISNIDSAAPIFRRITDNRLLRTRTDPEVFITDTGPKIYYNRLIPDTGSGRPRSCRNPSCSEGVWNSDPGPL